MARRARSRIARRLGGPAVRRRRHRRVALVVVLVSVLAAVLVVAGTGSDGGSDDGVVTGNDPITLACRASNEELATAHRALVGDDPVPGAEEGFLADAFVDLARDRSAAIRSTEPGRSPEVIAVLDEFEEVVDAVEADPSIGLGADPFAAVDVRWADLGLDECAIGAGTVADE